MFEGIKRRIKEGRGHLQVDSEKCTYCGFCQKKCPAKAITVSTSTKEWRVNDEKCSRCGRCTQMCPNRALSIIKGA